MPPGRPAANLPPTLFGQYVDTEVTVFGITGTLGQLAEMCPVAHDPNRMTSDAMDKFAAKVLHKAGVEIPEVYTHLLQENPGPSESVSAEPMVRSEVVRPKKPEPSKAKEKPAAEPVVKELAVRPPVAEQARDVAAIGLEPAVRPAKEPLPVIPVAKKVAGAEVIAPLPAHHRPPEVVRAEALAPKLEPAVLLIPPPELLMPKPLETQPFERVFPEVTALVAADEQTPGWEEVDLSAEADQLLAELGVAPLRYEAPNTAAEDKVVSIAPAPETAEPAGMPAEEVIRNFTEALAKVALPVEKFSDSDVISQSTERSESAGDPAPVEPILQEVVAKIDQIEPEAQKEAAQIILNIAEAVQKLADLPPVVSEATRQEAEEKLEELCLQLFEVIGHKVDEQAVKDFVRIVRNMQLPAFGELQTPEFIDYMHERKPGTMELPVPNLFAAALSSSSTQSTAFGYLALGRASRAWALRS